MVAFPIAQHLKLPLAPLGGGMLGIVFALVVAAVPVATLESVVAAIGLPTVLPAAQAPLGPTARMVLAVIGGGGVFVACWGVLLAVIGGRAIRIPLGRSRMPRFRRADSHRDAPVRAPLLATRDLGTPFLDVKAKPRAPVEQPLPVDLDAPLSAFDPTAIPAEPAEPVRAVASLVPRPIAIAPGERIETFELTPQIRAVPAAADWQPAPLVRPRTDATIHALLDRLEAGVARRDPVRRAAG